MRSIEKTQIDNYFYSFEKYYNDNLTGYQTDIEGLEKTIKEDFDKEDKLKYRNNVHNNKMYVIHHRIKDVDSIKEKLYRKDILDFSVEPKDVISNSDDFFGMKILVFTPGYLKIAKKRFENFLENHKEDIQFLNKGKQEDINKNGHTVYKYKLKYKNYGVEIQIDSSFTNTWNEIEHSIFYKDYNYTIVKNNNKIIMQQIGDVVSKVDNLIGQVASNETKYKEEDEYYKASIQYLIQKKLKNKYDNLSNYFNCFADFSLLQCDKKRYKLFSDELAKDHFVSELIIEPEYSEVDKELCDKSTKYVFFKEAYNLVYSDDVCEILKTERKYSNFLNTYISYRIHVENDKDDFVMIKEIVEKTKIGINKISNLSEKINNIGKYYYIYSLVHDYESNNTTLEDCEYIDFLNILKVDYSDFKDKVVQLKELANEKDEEQSNRIINTIIKNIKENNNESLNKILSE